MKVFVVLCWFWKLCLSDEAPKTRPQEMCCKQACVTSPLPPQMAFARASLCLCVRVLCWLLMATITVSGHVNSASARTSLMNLNPSGGNQIQDNPI